MSGGSARAVRAVGIVTGHRVETEWRERDGETEEWQVHRPVFRYRDAQGIDRDALSHIATNPPAHAPGEQVPILYDPRRPDEAVAEADRTGRRIPLILWGLGIGGFGFVLLRSLAGW